MAFGEHARPFLTFHVGQAGVQIGNAIWELLCLEHNILPSGQAKPECPSNGFFNTMFLKSDSGHFMPRTVFVDTDPTCLNEIRTGPYRDMFSSSQLISDHFDAGGNYTRGRQDFLGRLVPDAVDRFRWLMEKTDATPTAFLVHGISGGTGSGVAVSCLESLNEEFGAALRVVELNVTSGRGGVQNSCELVNQVMYQFESRNFTELSFSITNSAMFNVCRSGLGTSSATYAHVNRMLAMCFSNLTAAERFPATMSCTVDSIVNNVLPFKHLKHPVLACAPFAAADSLTKERINALGAASAVVEQDSQLADIDLRQGRHLAGVLIFRGAVRPTDVELAVASLRPKSRMEFVDWAPAGFKTGLVELPPLAVASSGIGSTPLSVTMVSNHSAVSSLFRGQSESIKKLAAGKYFLHNYQAAASGEAAAGHNSDVQETLREACDYMDSVAAVYESERPPETMDDSVATSTNPETISSPKRVDPDTPAKPKSNSPPKQRESDSPPRTGSMSPPKRKSSSPPLPETTSSLTAQTVSTPTLKPDSTSPPKATAESTSPPKATAESSSPPKTNGEATSPPKPDSTSLTMSDSTFPQEQPNPSSPPKPASPPSYSPLGATTLSSQPPLQPETSESVRTSDWEGPVRGGPQHPVGLVTTEDQPSEEGGGSEPVRVAPLGRAQPYARPQPISATRAPASNSFQDSSRVALTEGGLVEASSVSTPPSTEYPVNRQAAENEIAQRSGGPRKQAGGGGGGGGGCCKRRQQPPARAQSQNHGAAEADIESWRSTNSSDQVTVNGGGHRSRSASHNNHRQIARCESTGSSRSVDSSAELTDLIQSCLPEPALVSSTISSVRQIIEKYNQLFAKEGGPMARHCQ